MLFLTQTKSSAQSTDQNARTTYEYAVVEQKGSGSIIHYSSGKVEETKKNKKETYWGGVTKMLEALSENGWEVADLQTPSTGGSKILLKRKKVKRITS